MPRKRVMRIDVNPPITYDSIAEAGRLNHFSGSAISWMIANNRTDHGEFIIVNKSQDSIPVICIETGKRYRSIRQASKLTGIDYRALWRSVKTGWGVYQDGVKLHWQRIA